MIATSKKFVLDENKKEEINNNRITTQRFQNTFSVMADRTMYTKNIARDALDLLATTSSS